VRHKSYRSVSERASRRNCLPLSAVSNALPDSQALSLPPPDDLGPLQLPNCAQRKRTQSYSRPPSPRKRAQTYSHPLFLSSSLPLRASLFSLSLSHGGASKERSSLYLGISMVDERGGENNFGLDRVAVSPSRLYRYRPSHRNQAPAGAAA
jgi:hypothetical protein